MRQRHGIRPDTGIDRLIELHGTGKGFAVLGKLKISNFSSGAQSANSRIAAQAKINTFYATVLIVKGKL